METNLGKRCEYCPINPKAQKPYSKMVKIVVNPKDIEEITKIENKNPNCFICEVAESLLEGLKQQFKKANSQRPLFFCFNLTTH